MHISPLQPLHIHRVDLPDRIPSPFASEPHPLAILAAQDLQARLDNQLIPAHSFLESSGGRQFGVLVVKISNDQLAYLSAFSQEINGQSTLPGFIPALSCSEKGSEQLQLVNRFGEQRGLSYFYSGEIPEAAGNCATPRLLDYANRRGLTVIAMTEFWWGRSPSDIVRRHEYFYPVCKANCGPLLPFLLQGYVVDERPEPHVLPAGKDLEVLYEDQDLLLINKPGGLLSVPGKQISDSVLTRLRERLPGATGPLLLHRLDLSTSGLLLAAKNAQVHKSLQQQFMQREIEKTYIAVLDGVPERASGVIDLPLRVDLDDRPRQMVCDRFGKAALTRWERLSTEQGKARVHFFPETGRTHQLRVHAAHARGLNLPIVGDELYGIPAKRLMLHATELSFLHPVNKVRMTMTSPAPF